MLDLHLSTGQGLLIETPSGDVEVVVEEVDPIEKKATLDVAVPEEWPAPSHVTAYSVREEFTVEAPDGVIRIKVLRFRPRPDGTGGSVSLGIDAPREWQISR